METYFPETRTVIVNYSFVLSQLHVTFVSIGSISMLCAHIISNECFCGC